MFRRRAMLSLCAVAALAAGCRLFKPVNPNAPKQQPVERMPAPEPAPVAANPTPVEATPRAVPQSAAPIPRTITSLNDANIAAMVLASNNTDISYARLVPSRAERADIKEFARRMLTDHTGVNGMVTSLLSKLDLAPEDNEASLDMRDESATNRDLMRDLTGYAFDSTYIENEVKYHRKFLAAIDQLMVPRARNSELHALLKNVRPAVAAHLAHAEQVRANVLSKK